MFLFMYACAHLHACAYTRPCALIRFAYAYACAMPCNAMQHSAMQCIYANAR